MATKVYAPSDQFKGTVAGVVFADGVGEYDPKQNLAAHGYFRRHGFGIGSKPKPAPGPTSQAEKRLRELTTAPHVVAGTPLRDAAVDPKPEDFLPPTNAGKANPHGPTVVAPEIHHEGPKGIRPGSVAVDDAARQEREEKALAAAILIDNEAHPAQPADAESLAEVDRGPKGLSDPGSASAADPGEMPAKSASQKAWAAYAVSQGMDPGEADGATRASLIERYGGEG